MDELTLQDSLARKDATDPTRSYIVQAPAGSGKTEILTQRYLRLLSTVQSPEQIVALTFTRKAANEMRERILLALHRANQGEVPHSEHQKTTQHYANQALSRDKRLAWQMLQQPSRLRILTIDALCQMLSRSIPLQGKHIHYAKLCDKPLPYYLEAARTCFRYAVEQPHYQTSLRQLLLHLDNRQDKLIQLFRDLLVNRQQWIALIYQAKLQDKDVFEQGIAWIEQHELSRFRESIPHHLLQELMTLVRFLSNLTAKNPRLSAWQSLDELDSQLADELANLLLTSQHKLRKAFDHHVGLTRGSCPDETYHWLKQQSKALLAALDEYPDFLTRLLRIRGLPAPHYAPKQWEVLQSLFELLPLLLAHLSVLFTEHNLVDFTNISQQALLALGDAQEPTDLTLYLDHHIQHMLIDEFQDTSIQQFELITQLVQGWEPKDGRTLFIVGDPMQSIYRFRSAEVGLFLRAQAEGIGPVCLQPLSFRCNFRSTSTLVNWVNHQFKNIFPHKADIESGAVSFHASLAVHQTTEHTSVQAIQWPDKQVEAMGIIHIVQAELTNYPNDQIAILVRSRGQLGCIIQALRQKKIPFQGIDIDLLAHLPHIRDVCSLTEALLMPANRLAWLSVLRSPWCGLTLKDLHSIASFAPSQSIYWALQHLDEIPMLSDEGLTRAAYVGAILHQALTHRFRKALVDWVMETCSALHAESIYTADQRDDLEQFWLLLERFEQNGQTIDLNLFKQELETLYSQKVAPARLQIMTIHKSKGLEFDSVILPGLSAKPAQRDTPLFRWLQLPTHQQEPVFLLSPIKAAEEDTCLLYNYLGRVDSEKEHYESQRLLYVAVTRAKRRLYLCDHQLTIRHGSFRDSLQHQPFDTLDDESAMPHQHDISLPKRTYLENSFYQVLPKPDLSNSKAIPLQLTSSIPRLIGVVTHQLLCWICTYHPSSTDTIPWHLAEQNLFSLGLSNEQLSNGMQQIKQQFHALFMDKIGQWLISAHEVERNEYELLIEQQGSVMTRIIDRTFIEHNTRWIIDFKTGQHDRQTEQHHRHQVNAYASLFAVNTTMLIRCGLYYLASSEWVTWVYEVANMHEWAIEPI